MSWYEYVAAGVLTYLAIGFLLATAIVWTKQPGETAIDVLAEAFKMMFGWGLLIIVGLYGVAMITYNELEKHFSKEQK